MAHSACFLYVVIFASLLVTYCSYYLEFDWLWRLFKRLVDELRGLDCMNLPSFILLGRSAVLFHFFEEYMVHQNVELT